jgi:hypothetical protein
MLLIIDFSLHRIVFICGVVCVGFIVDIDMGKFFLPCQSSFDHILYTHSSYTSHHQGLIQDYFDAAVQRESAEERHTDMVI